jgi:4-amino-4-deoxychorismate lyase
VNAPLGTWIDGIPGDQLPADDRGLQYGDGLFETLLVRGGRPRFLDAHLARLTLGCERLSISFAVTPAFRAEIATICTMATSGADPCILKIVITRGSAVRRGYAADGGETARRILSLWPTAPLAEGLRAGVGLLPVPERCADNAALGGIKHLSRLENVLALGKAQRADTFDALMTGADGNLVSGAMSNVFLVRAGRVLTPPVDRAGVAGVLRGVVLRECAALGIDAAVQALSLADLQAADEVFITNARIGVVPVRRVGEHQFRMDVITRRLASHIEALDA